MRLKPLTLSKLTLLGLSSALLLACTTTPNNDVLQSKNQSTSTFVEGVPGGAFSEVDKISATVIAIDYKTRSVTLKDTQGNKRTVTAGPEVSNLEHVKVGNQVNIVAALETVIYLQERGQAAQDGAAGTVLGTTGSNVVVLKTNTEQHTTLVTAVNLASNQVTLQFPDNSSRTLTVRSDVALNAQDVGKKVVIKTTHVIAVTLGKH